MADAGQAPVEVAGAGSDLERVIARERVRSQLFGGSPAATVIDRFTVLSCLGSGGMGSVYAAYDPRLDRKVALKLLRDGDGSNPSNDRQSQGRLLREARAMAKLAHPNVGAVHDVGVCSNGDDGSLVWIAMEFIDGEDVLRWCRRARPSARELLDAYLQLGRGLAAAHAAGLVHRDVKPENAMRDRDGRVRVLDFGLAQLPARTLPVGPADLRELAAIDLEAFTQSGALVGTPAYMAPEQFEGAAADARSDQYSFCVALFEALWHVRPHAGDSVSRIAEERRCGRVVQPPRRNDVPRGIRAILLRGLEPAAEKRWPSMDALLEALERSRSSRRRSWIAAFAIGLAATFVVAAQRRPACDESDAPLAGAWDDDARARVRAGFANDTRAFVPATTEAVIAGIDRYVEDLRVGYHEACVATHDAQVQSPALLDVQSACLDVRRARLQALLTVFAAADHDVVERARVAVERLEPTAACLDRTALLAVEPPATTLTTAVAEVEAVLARAASERTAGHFDDAVAIAHEALAAAIATEYAPLVARAQLELARGEAELGHEDAVVAHAIEAHFGAVATQQHALAADAATVATDALPGESSSRAVAELWHRAGVGAADRMTDGARARADLDIAFGTLLLRVQDHARATEVLDRGLEILRARLGADAPDVWRAELMLARALVVAQRSDEAKALTDHALALAELQLRDDPPRLATALASISELYQFTGDIAAATEIGMRALALAEANLGRDHHVTNDTRVNLAALLHRARERERAAELLAAAVASATRTSDGPRRARAQHIQAIVLKSLDRLDEALEAETASSAWYREHMSDAPRHLVIGQLTLGNIQLLRDDNAAAERAYLEAVRLVDEHAIVEREVAVRSDYANFLFQTGRAREAIARYEELLALMRAKQATRYDLAQYEFDLARALWREGSDRERARAVATEVLRVLRTEPATPQAGGHIRRDWTAEEVETWFPDPDAWEED